MKQFLVIIIILLFAADFASAQRPPRNEPNRQHDWIKHADKNNNGTIERDEFDDDANHLFGDLDRNNDGVIDENESQSPMSPPRGERNEPRRGKGEKFGGEKFNGERFKDENSDNAPKPPKMPPPFAVEDSNGDGKVSRAEFLDNMNRHFIHLDKNGDGIISREEFDSMPGDPPPPAPAPPSAPTVEFLGAEMRFGDKLVKNAPFSAEIVMENTRRLYDGSTITAQSKGAIYRDAAGRARREQSLETVGGFSLGDAQKLIFITDASEGTQYFLDANRKIARRIPLNGNSSPVENEKGATESLGTKILEGVSVEGTRTTIEIPAGRLGNDKTLQVVTERWYSPELQTVIMTRHVDPLSGEHIFRLINIKRLEPARELFAVPTDYRMENDRERRIENRKQ